MKKQGITLLALALAAAMGMFGCGKGAETGAGASLPGTEVQDPAERDTKVNDAVSDNTAAGKEDADREPAFPVLFFLSGRGVTDRPLWCS